MAQITRTQLTTQSNSTFQDSPDGNITPPNHRAFNTNCIDSFANLTDNNTFDGINTFNAAVKVNHRLDTASADINASTIMDLGGIAANFITIQMNGVTITSFGAATQGTWRFLYFDGTGVLKQGNIACPTNADISVENQDSCMVICMGGNDWLVFNYQRQNGASVLAFNYPWAYGNNAPSVNENVTTGYLNNYRWIEGNFTKREYVLNDEVSGNWMPMGGRVGFTTGSASPAGDINFTDISFSGQTGSGGVSTITHDIRYHLVSDVFTMDGWVEITFIDLDNASSVGSFIIICPNDKNLNFFGPSTVTTAVGMGFARWNDNIAPHNYEILISGDSGNNELAIAIDTENPHFGTEGTLRIYFTLTAGVTIL